MRALFNRITCSPALVRVAPFILFVGFTAGQGRLGPGSAYWLYLAKTLLAGGLLWAWRGRLQEMRWRWSGDALGAGVVVFVLWVGLDGLYPQAARDGGAWNAPAYFGEGSAWAWIFIVARLAGASLVVPALEEVFYRSFLYRWLVRPDFESVALGWFHWKPFLFTSLLFGLAHYEWLPGILCGLVYQGLVCRHKRLGDAMTAHALTNLLLGLWVVWKGAWHFW